MVSDVLRSVEDFGSLAKRLDGELTAVRNLRLVPALSTSLGGDENNTITSLSTVDGCRGW